MPAATSWPPWTEQTAHPGDRRGQQDATPQDPASIPPDDTDVITALTGVGVIAEVAARLVHDNPDGARRQLRWLPQRKARDPAALLVRAIAEDWPEPPAAREDRLAAAARAEAGRWSAGAQPSGSGKGSRPRRTEKPPASAVGSRHSCPPHAVAAQGPSPVGRSVLPGGSAYAGGGPRRHRPRAAPSRAQRARPGRRIGASGFLGFLAGRTRRPCLCHRPDTPMQVATWPAQIRT